MYSENLKILQPVHLNLYTVICHFHLLEIICLYVYNYINKILLPF